MAQEHYFPWRPASGERDRVRAVSRQASLICVARSWRPELRETESL